MRVGVGDAPSQDDSAGPDAERITRDREIGRCAAARGSRGVGCDSPGVPQQIAVGQRRYVGALLDLESIYVDGITRANIYANRDAGIHTCDAGVCAIPT